MGTPVDAKITGKNPYGPKFLPETCHACGPPVLSNIHRLVRSHRLCDGLDVGRDRLFGSTFGGGRLFGLSAALFLEYPYFVEV